MKLTIVAALAALSFSPATPARELAGARDDEPPPVECPMCGGNAELHRARTVYMFEMGYTALLLSLATR